MKHAGSLLILLSSFCASSFAAENAPQPTAMQEELFRARKAEVFERIQKKPFPDPVKYANVGDAMALLLLDKGVEPEQANQLILRFCRKDPLNAASALVPSHNVQPLYRIYLLEHTRKLLTKETREAIEDNALLLLNKAPMGMSKKFVENAELAHYLCMNNGAASRWGRYTLALQVVRKAERYGPATKLKNGDTVDDVYQAWNLHWIKFFGIFPKEGTDIDIAHPTSYGACTVGVMYNIHDLADDPEVRRLAGNFLTLFWAEVASEFEPRTGVRVGLATTRMPKYQSASFWASNLLYCYGWHDQLLDTGALAQVSILTSSYRPPAIVAAIAQDRNRSGYLSTSRRPGMTGGAGIKLTNIYYNDGTGIGEGPRIIVDKNGDSHLRRDIYYTPDYALGTITTDPQCTYRTDVTLTPLMGATFSAGPERIVVTGDGYYPVRPISGITFKGVSIIARDPNASPGSDRFQSSGTRIFLSKGTLWDNRIEDPSGWFFTRSGNAYAAIKVPGAGYRDSSRTFKRDKKGKVSETEEIHGTHLELKDLWAPIVIQMGRAADYKSFEAFQASVKNRKFEYEDGKLTYESEAKDKYEYWAKGAQLPKINGTTVNLNPPKTYDSPYLSMKHGASVATISCPGHKPVVLDFSAINDTPLKATSVKP